MPACRWPNKIQHATRDAALAHLNGRTTIYRRRT